MVRMNPPRKIALVLACAATMLGWPPAVLAEPGKPVTYLALVWIKPDGQAHLAEYEKRFGTLMKHWNVAAKPNAVLMPQRLQSAQNGGFAYPLPSRVDVVTFSRMPKRFRRSSVHPSGSRSSRCATPRLRISCCSRRQTSWTPLKGSEPWPSIMGARRGMRRVGNEH